jgi:cytochrome c peroxidase
MWPASFALLLLAACEKPDQLPTVSATTALALGKLIFHDTSLSASGKQSCASCHSPDHAHAPSNALPVQLGGARLDQFGTRAVPSIRYLAATPAFAFDEEGTPSGGFNRDGSAETLAAQAERPLLAANEMANLTRAAVVDKLRRATYAPAFRAVYGEKSLDDVDTAFAALSDALQRYQLEAPEFHPFDSKYDAYLAGKVALTDAELRGLQVFNDDKRGNCAACHPSAQREDGSPPLFTDFTYDALGVARNKSIAANNDALHRDLGLCRSGRTGRAANPSACGKFKVPTLRNVATRQVFFHNGQVTRLRDAVAFYVSRDTHPEKWYPSVNGKVKKFDDLPVAYHRNVNVEEVPYDRKRGETPALSEQEIEDVLAFLYTLNDGYSAPRNTK